MKKKTMIKRSCCFWYPQAQSIHWKLHGKWSNNYKSNKICTKKKNQIKLFKNNKYSLS